ncbi:unnamed protein product [Echinostoma caproni]|uniref:Reverse transcriptase domain-containing protein n=1 Tax=Echinostoma caproni TaxID=27848 RepID=A0A183AQ02_9TREM|nr:unnamed protein product [Echinostoma caproni]
MICSADTLDEELRFIRQTLRDNGYLETFTDKNILLSPEKECHQLRWLSQGKTGCISSVIVGHLVDIRHQIKPEKAFDAVYRFPPNRSKEARI